MRRLIVEDDFNKLMKSFAELRELVRELIEQSARNEARFTRIENNISGLQTDVTTLKTDVAVLKTDVAVLKTDVAVLKTDVGSIKGDILEQTYRERPFVYLSRFARRLRNIDDATFAILIEDATDSGRITEDEAEELKRLDAIAKGKHKQDGSDIYLAVEVSNVVDLHDLERAERRAVLLAKATGVSVQAIIAGNSITAEAKTLAEQRGVYFASRS